MKYQRLIPLVVPVLVLLLCELFLREPAFFYSALALGALLIVLALKYIGPPGKINWLLFMILPLLFFISFATYTSVIIGYFWIQLGFLLIFSFLFIYLRAVYYYANYEAEAQWSNKLDNLGIAGSFLVVFATAAVLFILPTFFNLSLWLMLLSVALVVTLLLFHFKSFKSGSAWPSGSVIGINVVILTELAWAFSLLPLNFNILALFLALAYYLDLTILRLERRGQLNRQSLKLPLVASLLLFIGLLLTARWL